MSFIRNFFVVALVLSPLGLVACATPEAADEASSAAAFTNRGSCPWIVGTYGSQDPNTSVLAIATQNGCSLSIAFSNNVHGTLQWQEPAGPFVGTAVLDIKSNACVANYAVQVSQQPGSKIRWNASMRANDCGYPIDGTSSDSDYAPFR